MNVMVTGGAGFLGNHVVRRLAAKGHRTFVFDNLTAGQVVPDFPRGVKFFQADLCHGGELQAAADACMPDAVIHLAALHFIPACNQNPELTMQINLQGTLRLMLSLAASASIRTVIFASSGAVYAPDDRWHTEGEEPVPADIYGLSKQLAEQVVEHYARRANISSVVLRLANLYGPGETNPHLIPEIVRQIRAGQDCIRMGRTDTWRDFLFVADAAEAFIRAAEWSFENTRNEIFNLGTGVETCVADLLELMFDLNQSVVPVKADATRIRTQDRIHLRLDDRKWKSIFGHFAATTLQSGLRQTLVAEQIAPMSAVSR